MVANSFNYQIYEVISSKDLALFIDFPHDLYINDKNYVPELHTSQRDLLNKNKHPFFEHADAEYWVVKNNNHKVVGRIAAIDNKRYVSFSGKNDGFFGFFDVIDDYKVAELLLNTASNWLKKRSRNNMIGPVNFSTNESCGLLVENFDVPPVILTTYNAPYYVDFIERFGAIKYVNLLSYKLLTSNHNKTMDDLGTKLENRLTERGITIRNLDMKRYHKEIDAFLEVYNESWNDNMGFVPMTPAEVRQMGADLKMIIDPEFVCMAEKNGKLVGASLSIPNINEILLHVKRGRLLPTGLLKILIGRKKIKSVRIVALGILPEVRNSGLDTCFYVRAYQTAQRKGIVFGEASWILENNTVMNRALERIGGEMYRTHRLYQKAIEL
ncbi:MAG: hypothetical protein ACRCVT_04170 [Leadbetterella sp.]